MPTKSAKTANRKTTASAKTNSKIKRVVEMAPDALGFDPKNKKRLIVTNKEIYENMESILSEVVLERARATFKALEEDEMNDVYGMGDEEMDLANDADEIDYAETMADKSHLPSKMSERYKFNPKSMFKSALRGRLYEDDGEVCDMDGGISGNDDGEDLIQSSDSSEPEFDFSAISDSGGMDDDGFADEGDGDMNAGDMGDDNEFADEDGGDDEDGGGGDMQEKCVDEDGDDDCDDEDEDGGDVTELYGGQ